jgi:hypothetical protein
MGRLDQMTDKTAIQRIKELDHERATLFEQAKEEALRRASQAVEDLNALGLSTACAAAIDPAGPEATLCSHRAEGAQWLLPGKAAVAADSLVVSS